MIKSAHYNIYILSRPFLVAQMVKNLPAMQEMQVQSLGREDPPEQEMATHSGVLAWEIPWAEEPDPITVQGVTNELDMT